MLWFNRYCPEFPEMFRRVVANRAMVWFGLVGDIFQPVLMYFVWTAVYQQASSYAGMTHHQMITYVFVAHFCQIFSVAELEVDYAESIRSGDMVRDLSLPQSLIWKKLFQALGQLAAWGTLVGGPLLLIGKLFFGVMLPPLRSLPLLAVSLLLAMVINFAISFLTGTIAFYTDGAIWGISLAKRLISALASGALIPLSLFPDHLQTVARLLPFQASVHSPVQVYLGQLPAESLFAGLLVQVCWAAALLVAAERFFYRSLRSVTLQGG